MKKYNNLASAVKPVSIDVSSLENMANQAANNLNQGRSGGNQFLMQQFTINNPIYAQQPPPNRSYYRGSML